MSEVMTKAEINQDDWDLIRPAHLSAREENEVLKILLKYLGLEIFKGKYTWNADEIILVLK